jgi:hypothetical protein
MILGAGVTQDQSSVSCHIWGSLQGCSSASLGAWIAKTKQSISASVSPTLGLGVAALCIVGGGRALLASTC